MRTNSRRKSAISMKTFISELGENFSEHMKERLIELEPRCYLTRKEIAYRLDLKHVEHLKFECTSGSEKKSSKCEKEYVYGQFVVIDGVLYFSESCLESHDIMQSPEVDIIYKSLDSEGMLSREGRNLKKIDDNNIDYVIDSILSVCPQTSQAYRNIMKKYNS